MNVEILASGSSGNCAVVDDTLIIDAGWNGTPNGKYVLLTHHHTDHTKHLGKMGGKQIYCTQETADKLVDKFPYTAFNILPETIAFTKAFADVDRLFSYNSYTVLPIPLKHDAACVGFEIHNKNEIIFFATDFNAFVDDDYFVWRLQERIFSEIYIECNNTLSPSDFDDVYFADEGERPPRDEFHRRKSYQNHCNADYLISLFRRAGYSEKNRFAEPVTLLHKSSFYYQNNVERIAELVKICNVINPFY